MANIRDAIANPPMFIPWGGAGSAVNVVRAVGSRLGVPTLQGLANWARNNITKEAAVNATKQLPRFVAEDVVIDGIGNATTPITERYGDSVGFLKTVARGKPLATIIDSGLTLADVPWQDRFNNIKSFGATAAEAANLTPEEIDLSTQNVPSSKGIGIRLNENFATPQLPSRELNNDFTNLYNTPLTPIEQQGFNAWLKTLPKNQRSMRDYDLQGYYKFARDGVDPKNFYLNHDNPSTHFNDYFKKPNHPTFSVYSKYNGQDGWQGSRWYPLDKDESKWMLAVNPTNTRSPRGLARYMQEAESGNVFSDPRGQYSTVHYPLVTPDSNVIF